MTTDSGNGDDRDEAALEARKAALWVRSGSAASGYVPPTSSLTAVPSGSVRHVGDVEEQSRGRKLKRRRVGYE